MKIILLMLLIFTFSAFGQNAAKETQFFGNTSSNLFYQKNCREVSSIPAESKIVFSSREEAESKGFKMAQVCTKSRPAFLTPINVFGVSQPVKASKPVNIQSFRLKNLAEIDKDLAGNMNRLLEADAVIKVGGYFGAYLDAETDFYAFQINDGTTAESWTIYLYMERGESSEKICRLLGKAKDEALRGTFIFQIEEEIFWQRGRDRYALIGKLINYKLQETK